MSCRIRLFAWVALGLLGSLSGCQVDSGDSESSPITVGLTGVPGTLAINQSVNLTATVRNDSANAGVDWTCSPSGACGSFNPARTAAGGATVFTAPSTPGPITITATSTADKGAASTASVSIVFGSNAILNGPYVFLVQGAGPNGAYSAAGTILADGQGNITGGEQDYADSLIEAGPDRVTGNYTIGPDGRGSITLKAANPSLPNNGVETFSIAMASSRHALIIQFDGTATSSGTLDFQSAGSTLAGSVSGPYAFMADGFDIGSGAPLALGGIARLDAPSGTVTGGTIYANNGGNIYGSSLGGTMTAPDSFGRGEIGFNIGINFVYYAVRGEFLRLIESDVPASMSVGMACAQGPAGESLAFSNASLTGNYAFYESGSSTLGGFALAGQFTADGNGNFPAGFMDINNTGTVGGGSIAGRGVYAIEADGSGTLNLPAAAGPSVIPANLLIFSTSPAINLLDPNAPGGGGGALIMDVNRAAVGTGLIVARSGGDFFGDYALNLQAVSSADQLDIVGRTVADAAGSLTGTVDINNSGIKTGGAPLSGSSTADPANPGRWTATLMAGPQSFRIVYYQVNSAALLILDINQVNVGNGFLASE